MAENGSTQVFAAEVFTPWQGPEEQRAAADRIRHAAEALDRAGTAVRYLEMLHLPGEETAFYLFEADDPAEIERVLLDAGCEAERITPAITLAGAADEERGRVPDSAVRASFRR